MYIKNIPNIQSRHILIYIWQQQRTGGFTDHVSPANAVPGK